VSDDELQELGENIKEHGLQVPLKFYVEDRNTKTDPILLDGRNRLEAMERVGFSGYIEKHYIYKDPVACVIGLNIRRRHLTKEQQAELIVAAHKAAAAVSVGSNKPRQVGEVSAMGGRGKVDQVKAAVVADAEKHGISKRTVERALAKSNKVPSNQPAPRKSPSKPKSQTEALNSFAWSEASPALRAKWIDAVGVKSIWEAATPAQRAEFGWFARGGGGQ
jgi:hypothetical protein